MLGDEPVQDEWLLLRKGEFFSIEVEGFDDNMGSFREVMERRLSELVDRGY